MEEFATLEMVLAAREARQARIVAALDRAPLISFTMNIAGPQKISPLIRRGFREGCRLLAERFSRQSIPLVLLERTESVTGCEALFSAGGAAEAVKRICAETEDKTLLGRLFDMDVIGTEGSKLDRTDLGFEERGCMVCGAPGRGCAARRRHSVEELRRETNRRLHAYFIALDRKAVQRLATDSLLAEVSITPKPGLVDRANNGSHTDMDRSLFEKSAAALSGYWGECFAIGADTADLSPEETFSRLRTAGLAAEQAMADATSGINTHKGAIFLLGTVCGALGRLWDAAQPCRNAETICAECARMTGEAMQAEFGRLAACGTLPTAGAQLYAQHGLRGARGEIADGLPGVRDLALPALKDLLSRGCGREHAAAVTLLHLIARGTDTNMVKRGGLNGAAWGAEQAKALLMRSDMPTPEQISELDRQFIARRLSPGGCADLLAVTLFLHSWENDPE